MLAERNGRVLLSWSPFESGLRPSVASKRIFSLNSGFIRSLACESIGDNQWVVAAGTDHESIQCWRLSFAGNRATVELLCTVPTLSSPHLALLLHSINNSLTLMITTSGNELFRFNVFEQQLDQIFLPPFVSNRTDKVCESSPFSSSRLMSCSFIVPLDFDRTSKSESSCYSITILGSFDPTCD